MSRWCCSLRWISFCLVCVLLTGCRKDLCYHHDQHSVTVKVDAVVDWQQEWERPYAHQWQQEWKPEWTWTYDALRPKVPQGIRLVAYRPTNEYAESNYQPEGGRLYLQEGVYSLLFYNNDTEYIVFNDLMAVASASATTRTLMRGSFHALHQEERTMNEPDMLYGHYLPNQVAKPTLEPVVLPVTMKPLVYTYLIRYEFAKGMKYVALARGGIAGMAESVYLKDGHTGDEAATILYDCSLKDFGAEACVKTFGVPNYPGDHYTRGDGSPSRFALNLEVRLTNGKFKTFEFDVTDQVLGQPRGGVIVVKGLEISDSEGLAGSGGFDVEIEGWGDFIDIPLPL